MFPADFSVGREHVHLVFMILFWEMLVLFYVSLCFFLFRVYVSFMFPFFLRSFCKSLKLFSQMLPFPFFSVFFLHLFHLALQEMRAKQTTVYKVYTREWENDWVDEEGKVRIF